MLKVQRCDNAVVTCEIKNYFKIVSAFVDVHLTKLISVRGNLCEIILKLFERLIAAHEYFPTR